MIGVNLRVSRPGLKLIRLLNERPIQPQYRSRQCFVGPGAERIRHYWMCKIGMVIHMTAPCLMLKSRVALNRAGKSTTWIWVQRCYGRHSDA
jgi:hypothetical protein